MMQEASHCVVTIRYSTIIIIIMCILSVSAIHEGAIRCPVWKTSHMADFMIHIWGDVTLTKYWALWKCRNVYYKLHSSTN